MRVLRRRRALILAVLLLFGAAELRVFVWPPSDAPRRTDLVVVLGPWQQLSRPATGAALVRRYPGTRLLISVYNMGECPMLRKMTGDPAADCFVPDPFTTRGEARGATFYAREHGFRSMTVVTTSDQLVRAGVRFDRCIDAPIRFVKAESSLRFRLVRLFYQNAAMVKAQVLERGC